MATNDEPSYWLQNPPPLSQLQTELVWDGKYDDMASGEPLTCGACDADAANRDD
jgi:hypothetical protein